MTVAETLQVDVVRPSDQGWDADDPDAFVYWPVRVELYAASRVVAPTTVRFVADLLSATAAMFVNGVQDINAITRDDVVAEAVSWGRAAAVAAARVDELLARAARLAAAADDTNPPDDLREVLRARARALGAAAPLPAR